MVYSTDELITLLSKYSNPNTKIARMVKNNELYKIKKGVYESNKRTNPFCLSGVVYGPSYISFQTALSFYSLIPERVYGIYSATTNKRKTKTFNNEFGTFIYKDVPSNVYPYEINQVIEDEYSYYIAEKEKAICDTLYLYSPVGSIKEIEEILFEDLRIDEKSFSLLDMDKLIFLAEKYKTTNHRLLIGLIRRKYNGK